MNTLAIVIGNNNYYTGYELTNAAKDAAGIADVFGRLGFEVLHRENITAKDSEQILDEFNSKLPSFDASIFYFAGHGFQVDGENYLATIDCQISNPNKFHCNNTCITLTEILDILRKNSNKVNIVIIDACRRSFDRGATSAFSPIQAPKGTLIAFSTSPNEGAKDAGMGDHSIYTGTLLKFIGRQEISVEELFKKVRKTVYNLTEGSQTTWEHTSLIGDFYFNTGQLIHSMEIPYDSDVIKDANFLSDGSDFSNLIMDLRNYKWDVQNDALNRLLGMRPTNLNKNQQFILGRNLLQTADGNSFKALEFFENLIEELNRYQIDGHNNLFNGILFEIYFDSYGEFRKRKLKTTEKFNEIISLRKNASFDQSFDFIRRLLAPYKDLPTWIPEKKDQKIDVDVSASEVKFEGRRSNKGLMNVISSITVMSKNITSDISKLGITGYNEIGLKRTLSNYLGAPEDLIEINASIPLVYIAFEEQPEEFEY